MEMSVDDVGGVTRIGLTGKLDIAGAEAIDVKFTAAVTHNTRVAVDLSAVDYIASMGIRILVMAGKAAARRGGKLVLFGASEQVAKVLSVAGVTEIIPLVRDWDEAVAVA